MKEHDGDSGRACNSLRYLLHAAYSVKSAVLQFVSYQQIHGDLTRLCEAQPPT